MNISDKTRRLLLSVMLIMLAGVRAFAEDATLTAQAPQAVVVGERFRITYKATELRLVHSSKALFPIEMILSGNIMLVRLVHAVKE